MCKIPSSRNPDLQKEESGSKNLIHIDASSRSSTAALEKVYDEMTVQEEEQQPHENKEDLLDLLDSIM
jgi:hypothetical protein